MSHQAHEPESIICPNCGNLIENTEQCDRCQLPINHSWGHGRMIGAAIGRVRKYGFRNALILTGLAALIGTIALFLDPLFLSELAWRILFIAIAMLVFLFVSWMLNAND